MKNMLAFMCVVALIGSSPVLAQKRPERIRLTENSRDGAILIRVPVQPFAYSFQFSRNGNSGFLSRVYQMGIPAGPPGYRYIARTLSPGRYRLDMITQQRLWSACLDQGTIEIQIVPGRIAYVGAIDVLLVFESIQRQAIERDRTSVTSGDIVISRDENARPIVEARDEASLSQAREFAETVMNGSGRLVELAPLDETAFTTSAASRLIEVCG